MSPINQDPEVYGEARNTLGQLFSGIGRRAQSGGQDDAGLSQLLGGIDIAEEFGEFLMMPIELAQLFAEMGFDLAELVLKSLAEAGYVLVKGLSPAP